MPIVGTTVATTATAFVLACALLAFTATGGALANPAFRLDRLAAVMLVLIAGISTVVQAFAIRYMDGDPGFDRFFTRLLAVTLCTGLVVIANDLAVLCAGWLGVSAGLYALQTHYRDRKAALRAAKLMRAAHSAGDAAILAAAFVLWGACGTTRIDTLLSAAATLPASVAALATALLAAAGFSKSAQIPLHRWLPETMEAPTPVSALMHAGIVNASGFILARFSPLAVHAAPIASVIFAAGALTALWGGACMLVRSDVKRGLAYSTMAQMGYMTMQSGMGAFAASILHLFAHGIFKATLFLGSGYAVPDLKRSLRWGALERPRRPWAGAVAAVLLTCAAWLGVMRSPLGAGLPPYGWALLCFAGMTCAQAIYSIVKRGTVLEVAAAVLLAAVLLPGYAALVDAFDRFLSPGVVVTQQLTPDWLLGSAVAVFGALLACGWGVVRFAPALRDRLYVWLLAERLPLGGIAP